MLTQTTLQTKVAAGYARAATRVGAALAQYRPTALTAPLANPIATIMADFASDPDMTMRTPPTWGRPAVWALMDTTTVAIGDVFVGATGTYFTTRVEPYRPALCVLTNRIVSIKGQPGGGQTGGGACQLAGFVTGAYGPAGDVVLASGWPASVVMKGAGSRPDSGIPGAVKAAAFEMLLPVMPGFVPQVQMEVTTDLGATYRIMGVEPSQYGTRCLMEAEQI